MAQPVLDLAIRARAKIEADDFGGALAHAGGDIVAGDDQIVTMIILAAQHDMRVRMAGVEVIDRRPVELRAEIFFHTRHQAAGERLQVFIIRAILRCDDETELVAVTVSPIEERLAIGFILQRIVKLARLAVAGDAVALDITQMRPRAVHALAGQPDDARFDDDPALTECGMTVTTGEHAANPAPRPIRLPLKPDLPALPPARFEAAKTWCRNLRPLLEPRERILPSFGLKSSSSDMGAFSLV